MELWIGLALLYGLQCLVWLPRGAAAFVRVHRTTLVNVDRVERLVACGRGDYRLVLRDGTVLHNTPFKGEHVASVRDFAAGKRVRVTPQDPAARARALNHAERYEERDYNLFTNNCEHTVHRATSGTPESPQLKAWIGGVALATAAFALTRHPVVAAAGYALGRKLAAKLF